MRFPPHGGGGVQRTAYFVRYLRSFGWRPHVLTGPARERHILDRSLSELIPADVPVTRTRFYDVQRLHKALGRLRLARVFRTLTPFLPNMNASWVPFAYRAGARILAEERFDVIFSSAYPIGSHVVALLLRRRFGVPWVADYRDEWSLREVIRWPSPLHRRLARHVDRKLVTTADQVVTTSPAHTRRFSEAFEARRPIVTITNGFDPTDLRNAQASEHAGAPRDRFVICHVGTVFPWRSPDMLLAAVADLVDQGAIPADRVAVEFVGFGSPKDDHGLAEAGIVRTTGYVGHGEAVARMKAADLLLLFNTERSNIPGKTFEYIASGRPILALCAEGPTGDVVRATRTGAVLDPADRSAIARVVEASFRRWERGLPALDTDPKGLEAYTRRALATRLHEVFETVLA